jgi:drug/metabolite transporter (DMT)-like permease
MPLLFLVLVVVGVGSKAFSKLCSNILSQNSVAKYSLVLVVNSLVACLFFGISSGFRISVNGITLLYSAVYAAIAATAILSGVIVYRYASISNVNIVTSSCGMICTAVIGWLFFAEKVQASNLIRLAIMLVAIVFVFLDQRKNETGSPERKRGNAISLVLILAVITASVCGNTVVLKSFAMSERVTDENSFFFFTNVFLLIASLAVFAVVCLRRPGELQSALQLLQPKKLVAIAGNTVCSNVSSLVSVLIVAQLDVSIYSPIASALEIIVGVAGSLLFKEKLGVFAYIAAIAACIAVIL